MLRKLDYVHHLDVFVNKLNTRQRKHCGLKYENRDLKEFSIAA
jgi:hypothetical protein